MGSLLITFFAFSLLSLTIGCVDALVPTLPAWQVIIALAPAALFPLLKGKPRFVLLSVLFAFLLILQAWKTPPWLTAPLLGVGNLLLVLMLVQIPDFAGQRPFFHLLVSLFWAIGLCGYLFLPQRAPQAPLILVAAMWGFGIFFLIPSRFGTMDRNPDLPLIPLLLLVWYTNTPFLSVGMVIGILIRPRLSPWWGWLSLPFGPLCAIHPLFAIPLGALAACIPSRRFPLSPILSVTPVLSSSLWMTPLFIALGMFFGSGRIIPCTRRTGTTGRSPDCAGPDSRCGTTSQTDTPGTPGHGPATG